MRSIPAMTDMRLSPSEAEDSIMPSTSDNDAPAYPYGLSICLTDDELDKLDMSGEDVSVGDMLHLHALARVTSVSSTDTEGGGKRTRIELTLTNIAVPESEDEENEEAESGPSRRSKLYVA